MQYTVNQYEPISRQAASVIRAMIIDGEITDGARINEVHLSEKLGISRTPVREGLVHLMAENIVEAIPRRGFFACALTVSEFSDLYDLRPLLDPQALLLGGQPIEPEIDQIEDANQAFMEATDGRAAVNADDHFHRLLLGRCANGALLKIIENLIARTQRYELALFSETTWAPTAGNDHAKIIKALRNRDLAKAADCLRHNLSSGKEPILAWLSARTEHKKESL